MVKRPKNVAPSSVVKPVTIFDGDTYFGMEIAVFGASPEIEESFARARHHNAQIKLGNMTRPLSVLDAGGGTGHQAEEWAALGAEVTVIDRHDAAEKIAERNQRLLARGHKPITFLRCDMTDEAALQKALEGREFDEIVLNSVLHYMPPASIAGFFTTLRMHTTPGAHLNIYYLLDFDGAGANGKPEFESLTRIGKKSATFYAHDPKALESLLKKLGFGHLQVNLRAGDTDDATIAAAAYLLIEKAMMKGVSVEKIQSSAKHVAAELFQRDVAQARALLRETGEPSTVVSYEMTRDMYEKAKALAILMEKNPNYRMPELPKTHYTLVTRLADRPNLQAVPVLQSKADV